MGEIRNNSFIKHKKVAENEPQKKCILVFKGEKTEQKYFIILLKEEELKIIIDDYISELFFEFWLLLHKKEFKYHYNNLRDKAFIINELNSILGKYNKSNYYADLLVKNIHTAIDDENKFGENIKCLKNKIGSNVGLLINKWF